MRAGSAVVIQVESRNAQVEGLPLANPSSGVKLTLMGPTDLVVLAEAVMTNTATGIYTLTHQSQSSDALGPYTGYFKSQDGSVVVLTPDMVLFELVAQ